MTNNAVPTMAPVALLPIAVVDVGAAAGSADLAHQQMLVETTARLVQMLEVLRVD